MRKHSTLQDKLIFFVYKNYSAYNNIGTVGINCKETSYKLISHDSKNLLNLSDSILNTVPEG